jgi:hypothetical protein
MTILALIVEINHRVSRCTYSVNQPGVFTQYISELGVFSVSDSSIMMDRRTIGFEGFATRLL